MYSIKKYKDLVSGKDADTRKRYELVEKLSKGFTVENQTALEMDRLLTEQMELEQEDRNQEEGNTTTSTAKPRTKKNSKTANAPDIEQSFNELFEALKNHQPKPYAIDKDILLQALEETLNKVKIRFGDLDEDVQRLLSSQPQVIRYELPSVTTAPFYKPPVGVFQSIIDDVMLGNNVMLVGGAGTGKTYMAENLVAKMALGRQHITINCSQWTSPTEIIGGQTMDGYVEGKLIEAWQHGYVLILDELPKIDPNTAGLFNDALAKTKVPNAVIFNAHKESFSKHKDFACIATGNIYPDKESITYGANNRQDLSLLDRFSGSVYFIEKNPAVERKILQNDMVWNVCDKIRAAIEELKYEAQLSLRFMQNARDAYDLEMQRVKDKGGNGVKADEGKTFKSAVDSYLSTFTELQQKNIKEKMRYKDIFPGYAYRTFDKNKLVY